MKNTMSICKKDYQCYDSKIQKTQISATHLTLLVVCLMSYVYLTPCSSQIGCLTILIKLLMRLTRDIHLVILIRQPLHTRLLTYAQFFPQALTRNALSCSFTTYPLKYLWTYKCPSYSRQKEHHYNVLVEA